MVFLRRLSRKWKITSNCSIILKRWRIQRVLRKRGINDSLSDIRKLYSWYSMYNGLCCHGIFKSTSASKISCRIWRPLLQNLTTWTLSSLFLHPPHHLIFSEFYPVSTCPFLQVMPFTPVTLTTSILFFFFSSKRSFSREEATSPFSWASCLPLYLTMILWGEYLSLIHRCLFPLRSCRVHCRQFLRRPCPHHPLSIYTKWQPIHSWSRFWWLEVI